MQLIDQGGAALRAEAGRLAAALRERRLWLALGVFAVLLLLAAQAPLDYRIDVGREEGYGGDLPLLSGFHDFERANGDTIDLRWTTGESTIRLPGLGPRAIQLIVRLLPVNDEVAQRGPSQIEISADGAPLGALALRPATGAMYRVAVPAAPPGASDHTIVLRSPTYVPSGDVRALGAPVDDLRVLAGGGPLLPPWAHDIAWLGAALLLWLALRRAGFGPAFALRFVLCGAALAGLAAMLDPPRFAFGDATALTAAALAWLLALLACAPAPALLLAGAALCAPALALRLLGQGDTLFWLGAVLCALALALLLAGWLRPALGRLYARAAPPVPPMARRWLLLIALAVLATHYGGKIYPFSMWGDIGFHANRYFDVLNGSVLLLSRNRGVDFPYPPAFYLLLAPFSLTGLDRRVLLQLGGALLDAASPLLVYTIAVSLAPRPGAAAARLGLVAAGIYSFSAATLMTTWWNFSTHIFTQFAHLLLITAIVLVWQPGHARQAPASRGLPPAGRGSGWLTFAALWALQLLVYLGHFGFWMNMSLLGGMGLLALLIGAWRRRVSWAWLWRLGGAFVAAQLFAALFFYSAYTGLFLEQARATASGGLTGLAGRQATDRALLWQTLWDAGFRVHFGFFPIPLALCGLALLWLRRRQPGAALGAQRLAAALLMSGTFLIALLFALLPFVSGSTLSTRWLMFSAWAIAVGAALVAQLLWRSGRIGRWLVIAIGGYIVWVSAAMWLAALAWRIRPPEPF